MYDVQCASNSKRLSLSVLIFPGEPGLAGFIAAKDDGSGSDKWSYKTCKAPVKSSSPTKQHPTVYRPDVLPVGQPTVSDHWREKRVDACINKVTNTSTTTAVLVMECVRTVWRYRDKTRWLTVVCYQHNRLRTTTHHTKRAADFYSQHFTAHQWLKWAGYVGSVQSLKRFCEAGGLTWRSQVGTNPIPIPTPLIWR